MMRRTLLVLLFVGLATSSYPALPGQAAAPAPLAAPLPKTPAIASYTMDVELDPVAKTVSGRGRMSYINRSPDNLAELYLRLYLRAFRTMDTIWMQESGGASRGQAVTPDQLGDITMQSLKLASGTDLLASATLSDTLLFVPLPEPLSPGAQIDLDVTWVSTLPRVFARTGYGGRNDTFFMVGQWYPKLAVYDRGAWDTQPWHANAEFFHDFGDYDVTIRVPASYVVAGSGLLQGEPAQRDGQSISHYIATSVTDVAFAASPDFLIQRRQADAVEIVLYYLPEHASSVEAYLRTGVDSIRTFSRWYGQYPHERLTIVDVPDDAMGAGGMEYPTLVTGGLGGLPAGSGFVEYVTAHEIAHQWWPMQTATNEAREPWLDEGLTEYSGAAYNREVGDRLGFGAFSLGATTFSRVNYAAAPSGEALNQPAWEYGSSDYGALVYSKTALGLDTLEQVVGTERFRQAMATYLSTYRFRHPQAADFRASVEESLGSQPWFFDEYVAGGTIDYAIDPASPVGSTVHILRKGSVHVPVEIRLTYADGSITTHVWEDQAAATILTAPSGTQIVRVDIDPEYKLVAETQRGDNGYSSSPLLIPVLQLVGRLLFAAQSFGQLLGLLG
jgi:hypothetical protein